MFKPSFLSIKMMYFCTKKQEINLILRGTVICHNALWEILGIFSKSQLFASFETPYIYHLQTLAEGYRHRNAYYKRSATKNCKAALCTI